VRTGGASAAAYPTGTELAGVVVGCVERGLPFKCTAGLHHAVRSTDQASGLEQHGFLNVMLAVRACVDDADGDEIAAILAERDPASVAAAVRALDEETAGQIRWLFTSFGTCSTDEPVADLVSLGLLSQH